MRLVALFFLFFMLTGCISITTEYDRLEQQCTAKGCGWQPSTGNCVCPETPAEQPIDNMTAENPINPITWDDNFDTNLDELNTDVLMDVNST